MAGELGYLTLGVSCRFASHGAAAGRVAASATDDAAEHARVDEPLRVSGEERQERELEDGELDWRAMGEMQQFKGGESEWVDWESRFLNVVGSGSLTMRMVMTFAEETLARARVRPAMK